MGDPVAFADEMASFGPISHTRVGNRHLWFVSDSELIEATLVGLHRELHKDEVTRRLAEIIGNGLVTSEDELWKRQRRLAAPSFTRAHIATYAGTMVECAREYADALEDGVATDVHADMSAVTLRIVVRVLFGADVADEVQAVGEALETCMVYFDDEIHTWRMFLPRSVPTPGRRRFERARVDLDAILARYITARRDPGSRGDDLLSRFLEARDVDGSGMDEVQLRDEAMTMFAAGHETTAIALTNALLHLARHPEAARRLDAELAEQLPDRDPSVTDVERLKWCDAVVRESMRLQPPAWIIGREPTEPVSLGGFEIGAGEAILVPIAAVHRSARWYDAPDTFRPERWLDGSCAGLPRFAYLPFGGGPRVCIGNHFAMMELVLVLATLWRRVRYEVPADFRMTYRPAVTLRPAAGLPATVRRR